MTRIRRFALALLTAGALALTLTLLTPPPLSAQATINTTTLAAALGADTTSATSTVSLASGSTIAVGQILYVDQEAMKVTAAGSTSTIWAVQRGMEGTTRAPHASGAVVYSGPPNYFQNSTGLQEVSGLCTASAEIASPRIYLRSGNIYQCAGSRWAKIRDGGIRAAFSGRLANGGTAYTAAGAITIEPGFVWLNGTTLAMTLADPTTEQDGTVMCILALNASAHTVTYTAGFGGGTTARDVATYGGAINDGFCIVARSNVWWVIPTSRNVTIA